MADPRNFLMQRIQLAQSAKATGRSSLESIPDDTCTKLADWTMQHYGFGPLIAVDQKSEWKRENIHWTGDVNIEKHIVCRDVLTGEESPAIFHLKLDHTGFPVYSKVLTPEGDDHPVFCSKHREPNFDYLRETVDISRLGQAFYPVVQGDDTSKHISEWAFDNIELPEGVSIRYLIEDDGHFWLPDGRSDGLSFSTMVTIVRDIDGQPSEKEYGMFTTVFDKDKRPVGAFVKVDDTDETFGQRHADAFEDGIREVFRKHPDESSRLHVARRRETIERHYGKEAAARML